MEFEPALHGIGEYGLPQTPRVAVDAVIRHQSNVILIERKYPPLGFALPGGFVDIGETCESAVVREALEETNLICRIIRLIGVYSNPDRDPRGHIITVAFELRTDNISQLKAKDDAKEVHAMWIDKAMGMELVADHTEILLNSIGMIYPP